MQFYTGMTQDFEKRLAQHNSGKVKSTKSGIPCELRYLEGSLANSQIARKREIFWKRTKNKKWLEKQNWIIPE